MIVLPVVLRQLQRWDARRSGVPGEHWATFGTGLAVLRMAGPGRSRWLRAAAGVVGVALIWRAASGRDGFLRQLGGQTGTPADDPGAAPAAPLAGARHGPGPSGPVGSPGRG